MIYRKEANFPYPVLANTSHTYLENYFNLDVSVNDSVDLYHFNFTYEIESEFMKDLIQMGKAQCILVIQTKDNKFFKLAPNQRSVEIKKTRISLEDKISIQLHIQALEPINFANNEDLNGFYQQFKEQITVPKFSLLGYSNIITFNGSIKKPYELFEKRVDEKLKSDIKIELGTETIIIHFKKEEYQFAGMYQGAVLNNPYIYAGLTKALQTFIINNSDEDESIDLYSMEEPEGGLDYKLYNLMIRKQVSELNYDNIDEVIHIISDRIIEKYTTVVREMATRGD